ncbi:MAG: ankyrin repeat domain-containing protein [Armatimonadota bacterium]
MQKIWICGLVFISILLLPSGVRADKVTDLCKAAAGGDLVKVTALVTETPGLVQSRDTNQWTALCHAAKAGKIEVATYLLDHGADVNAVAIAVSPLYLAAREGHPQTVELLIEHGATLEFRHNLGDTALTAAIDRGFPSTVKVLLDHGADYTFVDGDGVSPLHKAAAGEKSLIVQMLLAKGADVALRDDYGRTPLYHAVEYGTWESAKMLLAKGADANLADKSGIPPLRVARERGITELIRVLILYGGKDTQVYLAGVDMPAPRIVNTVEIVPLRFLCDWLGAGCLLQGDRTTVSFQKISLILNAGSTEATVNGTATLLPAPVQSIGGVTYVPLRAFISALALPYAWDHGTREATLRHPQTGEKLIIALQDPAQPLPRPGKRAAGIFPLYDMFMEQLLGGLVNGRLVESQDVTMYVKDNTTYKVYAPTRYLGRVTVTMPKNANNETEDAEQKFSTRVTYYTDGLFGIAGDWNALPRTPVIDNTRPQVYINAVSEVLKAHGLKGAKPNIRQIMRIDLENDGQEEVVITAQMPNGDFHDLPDMTSCVKKNCYSFVMIRKIIAGKAQNILLDGVFRTKDATEEDISQYSLLTMLDIDGDGVLEIIVDGHYYVSGNTTVYSILGDKAKELMMAHWGDVGD